MLEPRRLQDKGPTMPSYPFPQRAFTSARAVWPLSQRTGVFLWALPEGQGSMSLLLPQAKQVPEAKGGHADLLPVRPAFYGIPPPTRR